MQIWVTEMRVKVRHPRIDFYIPIQSVIVNEY